jgi:hypothetical protein
MGIKRLLIIATIFLVGVMLFDGLYHKDAPLMWLASTSPDYAYIRTILVIVLAALFVSSPPRSHRFRLFLGGFATALFGGTLGLSMSYAINLLDAVVFTEVAIIFMIEALEADLVPVQQFNSHALQ